MDNKITDEFIPIITPIIHKMAGLLFKEVDKSRLNAENKSYLLLLTVSHLFSIIAVSSTEALLDREKIKDADKHLEELLAGVKTIIENQRQKLKELKKNGKN